MKFKALYYDSETKKVVERNCCVFYSDKKNNVFDITFLDDEGYKSIIIHDPAIDIKCNYKGEFNISVIGYQLVKNNEYFSTKAIITSVEE